MVDILSHWRDFVFGKRGTVGSNYLTSCMPFLLYKIKGNSSSVTQRLKDQVPKFHHLKADKQKSGAESPIKNLRFVKPFSLVKGLKGE